MIIQPKSTRRSVRLQPVNCFLEFESDDSSHFEEKSTLTSKRSNNSGNIEKPTKRRVQIDTSRNQCHEVEICQTREEIRARWFSKSELKGFRSTLSAEGKRLMGNAPDSNASFRQSLKEIYTEQQRNVRRNSNDSQQLTWSEQHYLEQVRHHPELLGLERFILDFLTKNEKAQRKRQQVIVIRDLQKSAEKCGFKCDSNADFIRHACETANQQSYAMARRIAQIQATHLLSFHEPATATETLVTTTPKQHKHTVRPKQEQTYWSIDRLIYSR